MKGDLYTTYSGYGLKYFVSTEGDCYVDHHSFVDMVEETYSQYPGNKPLVYKTTPRWVKLEAAPNFSAMNCQIESTELDI